MLRLAGSLLTTPLTRRLIPQSPFLSVATASGTIVSSRTVPRIALVCIRSFGTEVGPDEKDKPRRKIDKNMTNVYAQNQIWKQKSLDEDEDFFKKLGSGHTPDYMWIGCADARVPANEIMGEPPGSVFVVRNVANMVVSNDMNLMAALQYAVNVLKIPHIIVCGHYDCGGVRASMVRKDHVPPLENWLRNIRDVYRLHRHELNAIEDPEKRHCRLVELNVIEQCINLFKTGCVQRRRLETYEEGAEYTSPQIHACVFDPKIGDLVRLTIDSKDFIEDLHPIYGLYTLGDKDVIKNKPNAPQDE